MRRQYRQINRKKLYDFYFYSLFKKEVIIIITIIEHQMGHKIWRKKNIYK